MNSRRNSLILALAVFVTLGVSTVQAQSKKVAKEAEKLSAAGDAAKEEIKATLGQMKSMLDQYNAIMDGSANRKSAYKALNGEVKVAQKMIDSAAKSVDAMNKQGDRLYEVWQSEIDKISDDGLKARNQERLETRRGRYSELQVALNQARDELMPFFGNLNDQITFLGHDLTDDAILDLQGEAKELNELAAEISAKITALASTVGVPADAGEAEMEEAEEEPEEELADEGELEAGDESER